MKRRPSHRAHGLFGSDRGQGEPQSLGLICSAQESTFIKVCWGGIGLAATRCWCWGSNGEGREGIGVKSWGNPAGLLTSDLRFEFICVNLRILPKDWSLPSLICAPKPTFTLPLFSHSVPFSLKLPASLASEARITLFPQPPSSSEPKSAFTLQRCSVPNPCIRSEIWCYTLSL